ncbi:MAG: dihydropyrimidinase [Firmicutes bacterium]|nr:dihydropyrimidinase [Bacillota bacterium]
MSFLIKNGTIVTAVNEYIADILVKGEKIVAIGDGLDDRADKSVDATGMYVLPGGVDQHTHFALPFGGTLTRGFETSPAAAVGGTTTVVDFVPQPQGMGLVDSVTKHIEEQAEGKAAVDYAFHSVVMDVTDSLFDEIPKLAEEGIPTMKLFMAYKGTPYMVDDSTLFKALLAAKKAGVTIMVHAENGDLIDVLQKQCIAANQVEPKYHAVSRPPGVETEATIRALNIAGVAEAPIFIVHVSTKEAMWAIRQAYAAGQPVYGETCPHYLSLDVDNLSKPDFEGAKYVCSPALRTSDHREALWQAIQNGWLQVVGSDHCGFDWEEQKHMGRNDFTKIPNGAPGVENRLAVLWTYGVEEGKLSRQRLVDLYATSPAKFNGLFPRKGHIGIGADADLVLYDPKWKGIMTVEGSLQGVDYCSYEGMKQIGRPEKVYLRGKLIVDNGDFIGEKDQGIHLKGEPFGAAFNGTL